MPSWLVMPIEIRPVPELKVGSHALEAMMTAVVLRIVGWLDEKSAPERY